MTWRFQLVLVLLLLAVPLSDQLAAAGTLLVVANRGVPEEGPLDLSKLAAIFLLRTTLWPDGTRIVPVNREAGSDARATFTRNALREDNAGLAAYWNAMHFSGKQPPVVQESDAAMLSFIRRVPGAIGYIDAETDPSGVKILGRIDGGAPR